MKKLLTTTAILVSLAGSAFAIGNLTLNNDGTVDIALFLGEQVIMMQTTCGNIYDTDNNGVISAGDTFVRDNDMFSLTIDISRFTAAGNPFTLTRSEQNYANLVIRPGGPSRVTIPIGARDNTPWVEFRNTNSIVNELVSLILQLLLLTVMKNIISQYFADANDSNHTQAELDAAALQDCTK